MQPRRIMLFLLGLALTVPLLAHAFERSFPDNARSGKLTVTDYPNVELDGKTRPLSGGARIWSADNLTVIPNALGGATYRVVYTEDLEGAIDRVWILTDEEIAALPAPPRRLTLIK